MLLSLIVPAYLYGFPVVPLRLLNGPCSLGEKYKVTQQHVANLSGFGDAVDEVTISIIFLMLPR